MASESEIPRYCARCGEIFDARTTHCPECGCEWPRELPTNLVACYALLLTEITNLRRRGEISSPAFVSLRRIYEDRLRAVRPARSRRATPAPVTRPVTRPVAARAPVLPPPPVLAAQAVAAPAMAKAFPPPPMQRPAAPPRPPRPPRDYTGDMRKWAARRQADLVLYLGAFLLTISALIFVSYQGSGLNGWAKSGLFGGYTLIFLVLGLQLRRWTRVQEAGPIFLALGAVLTPLNFVALYTNVLRNEDVPQEYLWLAGSLATGTLYSLFAWKGFGKLYWIPAGGAFFAAYASLGATLQLPREWYGPWFMGLAVAANFVAHQLPARFRGYTEGGAYALGIASLFFTHSWVAFESGQHAALPAAHALAFIGIARSAFPSRRPLFAGLLPVFAATTAATTAWAIEPWESTAIDWAPAWLLAVSAGYLIIARVKPSLSDVWAALSLVTAGAAIAAAHGMVADGDIPWRLPVAYSFAAFIATAWYTERRYPAALAFVPALLAATAASAFWAADALAFEWLGAFIAAGALGYVVLARFESKDADYWRLLAAAGGVLALAAGHLSSIEPDANRWQLPTVYGLIAAGATFDAFRLRASSVVAVFALAAGGAAALWAFEVHPAYWAIPALALAFALVATELLWRRDAELRAFAWPVALALAAAPLPLTIVFTERPWVGAASFVATAVVLFALAARTNGAFARMFNLSSERAARVEQQMFARFGSWALFGAVAYVIAALGLTRTEAAWVYATAGIASWLNVAALRSQLASLEAVLGPVGLSAVAVGVLIATPDLATMTMIFGIASVAAALATGGPNAALWRIAYAVAGGLGILAGHYHAADVGVAAWHLPAAYGFALAAVLWDSAWNRFQPAMLVVPALASVGAATVVWWQGWPVEHMAWTPLAFALGIAATERLWRREELLHQFAWPYVLALALTPIGLVDWYRDEPWAGVVAFALASVAWLAAVLRSNGALTAPLTGTQAERVLFERQALAVGAFGLALAALGHAAFALEIERHHAAWAFAGATGILWVASVALRRRLPDFESVAGPASLAGVLVGVFSAYPHHEHSALILGATSFAAALAAGGRYIQTWRLAYVAAGVGGLLFAHNQASLVAREAWQLPALYGIALAALLWDSARNRYQPAMLAVPLLSTAGATALGWWRDWPVQHLAWAPLGIALALAASETLWRRGELLRHFGWFYVVGLSLAPFALFDVYRTEAPWAGAAAFALAAVAWAATAWRSNGALGLVLDASGADPRRAERQVLALGSYALGLFSLGFFDFALELPLTDSALTFGAVGFAAILATCRLHPRLAEWDSALMLAGIVAQGIAIGASLELVAQTAAMFALSAVSFVASGVVNRRGGRVIAGSVLAAVALATTWVWREWPGWSLALVYAGIAAGLFAILTPTRRGAGPLRFAANVLSVAPATLAMLVAFGSVTARSIDLPAGEAIVRTPEWGAMVATLFVAGALLFAEGLMRKLKGMALAGTAVAFLGLELALASLQVENIQVHTIPLAVYAIALGLAARRSGPLFGTHMFLHEGLLVLGAAILVLPPAQQSFAPGGEDWGLVVIVEGILLLAAGLALVQRWLAVSGVVALVGVAGRFVFDATSSGLIPYWVTLGVAGIALLAVGVIMLLERDWWDRARTRIAAWWLEAEGPDTTGAPPAHGVGV